MSPPPPLTGKIILVTRAAGQSSQFTKLLQQQGATVMEMPALEIGPPSSWAALDEAIAHLNHFDWLILTSTNGVDYFFERLSMQENGSTMLKAIKIAVVGQKTATRLRSQNIEPDFIPPDFVADALVETFPETQLNGLNILFPRVETGGREVLVQAFTAKGAIVTEVPAYQSCCTQSIPPDVLTALQHGTIDILTFASSKTVHCFTQLLPPSINLASFHPASPNTQHPSDFGVSAQSNAERDSTEPLAEVSRRSPTPDTFCIASIGPQTSTACIQQLGRVDVEAEEYTLEGLTQAIVRWVGVLDGHYEVRQT